MIGLYVHIPYCRTVCPYCDFVRERIPGCVPDAYIDALCHEIAACQGPDVVGSVFFGGGTPSLLSRDGLDRVLEALARRFRLIDAEITLEANPDDVTAARARGWRDAGVNRVSLGVQSFDDAVLRYLGRRHDAASARRACETVAALFDNWSLDLIYGAPVAPAFTKHDAAGPLGHVPSEPMDRPDAPDGPDPMWHSRPRLCGAEGPPRRNAQPGAAVPHEAPPDAAALLAVWEATLERCVSLAPPHVAAYGLTYEPDTPFGRRAAEALEDDLSLALYEVLEARLADYDHYEISNFARAGRASRHNLVYWRNGEYAGFGTGAYGFIGGVRARNPVDTAQYLRAPGEKAESETLTEAEVRVETVIQHMRLREGLGKADYRARFGADVEAHFGPVLAGLIARGLVEDTGTHLRPTRRGFHLNNEIGLALVG